MTPPPTTPYLHHSAMWIAAAAALAGLVLALPPPRATEGLAGYAPLHTILEIFAVAVGAMVTGIAWGTRRYETSPRAVIAGSLFLGVCLLDVSHLLTYEGMPDFITPSSADKSIAFWLAARSVSVLALLVAALPNAAMQRLPGARSPLGCTVGVLVLVGLLHVWFLGYPDTVPPTFIPGQGLTAFKVAYEYALIGLFALLAATYALRLRQLGQQRDAHLLVACAVLAISEFFFTRYSNVNDLYNLIGHVYKAVGYGFLFLALFVETVRAPYQALQASREQLRATLDALPDLLFEVDRDGRYLAVHAQQSGKLAAPPEQLVGHHVRDVMPAEAADTCLAALAEADRDGSSRGKRIALDVPDGQRHFELSVSRRTPDRAAPTFLVLSRDVTDAVMQQRHLETEARLNAALLEIHQESQAGQEKSFLQRALDKSEALTDSQIAFLHFINDDQASIELVTWSTATLAHYCHAAYDSHYPLQQAGIWADAQRQRRPVVINDYATATGKHGLPEGHAALHRLISLPVLEGGEVRMMVGVGNKPIDYTPQDVLTLQILANAIWTHVKHRRQEDRIRLLSFGMDQSPNPVIITNANSEIQYVNAAFTALTGYRADEAIGQNPRILHSGLTPPATYRDLWQHLSAGKPWRGEFTNRRKDGSHFTERASIYPMRDERGHVTHYIAHKEDITAEREVELRIQRLTQFDPLTGLANRTTFENLLLKQLGEPGSRCAVLWLDLDNFKLVNETLGYAAGDLLLLEAANRLRSAVPDHVKLARPPTDAFLALIPDCQHACAATLAGRLLETFQQPFSTDGSEVSLSASIGVSIAPDDAQGVQELLTHAELAMYTAKRDGRNTFRFFADTLQTDAERTLRLLSALKQALARNELRLVYQPQATLADQRLIGAEALLRWHHSTLGDISPSEFIPLAEQSGMIVPIGTWVIEQAARQVSAWRAAGLVDLTVAVNLSSVQFRQPELIDLLQRVVASAGIPPESLELELTEAMAMTNPVQARSTLKRLSEQGFRLAIDDFGTGYSSMSYLKQFTVDRLKIDASFVRDLDTNPDDQAIVSAIIHMAHGLGMRAIAEGVETESQLRYLRARGCDELQGYWYSRPLEADAFEAFCRERRPAPVSPRPAAETSG